LRESRSHDQPGESRSGELSRGSESSHQLDGERPGAIELGIFEETQAVEQEGQGRQAGSTDE
jgi:hypothetical protein